MRRSLVSMALALSSLLQLQSTEAFLNCGICNFRFSFARSSSTYRVHPFKSTMLRMKTVVQDGDVVGVRYKGTLDDGSVFDENPEGPLLEFEVGSGRVISGFDEAVRGLSVGEKRKVPREQMPTPPEGNDIEPGLILQLSNGQLAVVKEVTDEVVILDGNHPLAGKPLNFEVELFEIKDRDEVLSGKIREMYAILNNEVFSNLAAQVTGNPSYVKDIKARIEKSEDKAQ
ncbi:FKBP-type peptidyl-prolyl cis-trans isomerase [Guillardia theta CCMP2712]|uniref:peptidylprolyl isomerase n=1 Tax=Guillardia theta (strain CCMP2712) TaxID=905079 RepID=L1J5I2_GUITC|nr:FKBP-type peptidyl-prolyl cis-trans isomerase [Guillardia theta CCMP2712]EKX43607.1 FKBP-type peptidyl-prolyl cis-trans isomerase [Guillardia theta CCMP2712]|eukprot:XP_005830587.1 FKBP-type peptidyl-prolyl cis-trans isomerase [Guillardia theta CCMP2712]